MSDVPVTYGISPSIHPNTLERFTSHPDATVASYARLAMSGFEAAYNRFIARGAEVAALRADKDLAIEARQRKIGEANTRASSEAREKLGKLVQRLDHAVAESATKIEKAVRPPEPSPYAAESRSHVRNLPGLPQRMAFITEAAQRGEAAVVFEVLDAPGFLTGLDELSGEDREMLKRNAILALAPKSKEGLEDLERIRDAVRRGAKAVG